jgi:hypothetical protein
MDIPRKKMETTKIPREFLHYKPTGRREETVDRPTVGATVNKPYAWRRRRRRRRKKNNNSTSF